MEDQFQMLIDGEAVENVCDFTYLGANFTNLNDDSKEIKRRIGIAENATIALTNIWKDKAISLKTKKRLLQSLVFSIATYGSECWLLKNSNKRKIEAFELWCYRRMLRISWTEKKTNDWVLNKAESCNSRLLNVINRRKLSFVGHVLRSNGLDKTLVIGMVFGSRGRGRPKTRFSDNIKEISGGLSLVSLCKLAQDRTNWRKFLWRVTAVQPNELTVT